MTVAGLNGTAPVRCSRGVVVVPDAAFSAVQNDAFDVIVLPGGGDGAKAFAASDPLKARIKDQADKGKLVAAICAGAAPARFFLLRSAACMVTNSAGQPPLRCTPPRSASATR